MQISNFLFFFFTLVGSSISEGGCFNNCLKCDTKDDVCLVCKHPTSLNKDDGTCILVEEPIQNCLFYSTSDPEKCKLCKEGFFGDDCQPCGANCKNCQEQNECNVCNSGYFLDSGKCEQKCNVENCEICQNDIDRCKICIEGNFFLLNIYSLK